MSQQGLRKVVFPVAGLGTRFLPASKVVAKEMLPVLDKPLIQYAVDEAIDAGADTLIFVTNRYKHAIADYFDVAFELEHKLERAGKSELLDIVRKVLPKNVKCVFVTQSEALGLGHAIHCAKPVVGDEPFGVILPDDLIWNKGKGALRQMAEFALSKNAERDRRRRSAARRHRQVRHRRRHTGIRPRVTAQARRRKAETRRRAVQSRHRRPLRAAWKNIRTSRNDKTRRRRRNPDHRRHRSAAQTAKSIRLPFRRHALRLRQQTRTGKGDIALRLARSDTCRSNTRIRK